MKGWYKMLVNKILNAIVILLIWLVGFFWFGQHRDVERKVNGTIEFGISLFI